MAWGAERSSARPLAGWPASRAIARIAMTVGERIITSLRGRRQGGQDAANDRCQARLDALGRGEDIGV